MTSPPPGTLDVVKLRVAWEQLAMLPDVWHNTAAHAASGDHSFEGGVVCGLGIATQQLADVLPVLKAAVSCAHGVMPGDRCAEGRW